MLIKQSSYRVVVADKTDKVSIEGLVLVRITVLTIDDNGRHKAHLGAKLFGLLACLH